MFTEACCQLCLNKKAVFSFHQSMFKREHHRYADLIWLMMENEALV